LAFLWRCFVTSPTHGCYFVLARRGAAYRCASSRATQVETLYRANFTKNRLPKNVPAIAAESKCQSRKGGNQLSSVQRPNIAQKIGQFAKQFQYAIIPLVLFGAWPACVLAQDSHLHAASAQQELTSEQHNRANALIEIVRESTERFKDVAQAEREGYALSFGC